MQAIQRAQSARDRPVPVRVGIAGVTGYTGAELVRLLAGHPGVQLIAGSSQQHMGRRLGEVFAHLGAAGELCLQPLKPEVFAECDAVFLALPHGNTAEMLPSLANQTVVDLSADLRLRDAQAYEHWYGKRAPPAAWLERAVYGLPELFREDLRGARLIANPGCYVTCAALAVAPLLAQGLIDPHDVVLDCKSAVSGAGRAPALGVHFAEIHDNLRAYNLAGQHRHTPEIEQTLSRAAGHSVRVTFSPHMVPLTRGLLTTAYVRPTRELGTGELLEALRSFYRGEPFIRVQAEGRLPEPKHVAYSNYCDIGAQVDSRTGRAIVVAVIDNLVKGAAGQALQNLNLAMGFHETAGLEAVPAYP